MSISTTKTQNDSTILSSFWLQLLSLILSIGALMVGGGMLPSPILGNDTFSQIEIKGEMRKELSSEFIRPVDFDADGDQDAVAAFATNPDTFVWYENDGGDTAFTRHIIESDAGDVESIYPRDFNGDGDMDVVTLSGDTIAWYENDGTDTVFTRHVIRDGLTLPGDIHPIDFDSDGNMDVLAAYGDTFAWFENDGTDINFTRHTIESGFNAEVARDIHAVDFDGDGNMDVATAANVADEFAWYENDGSNTSFTRHVIESGATNADGAHLIQPIDFEGDGDTDVVTAARYSKEFAWYENDGSNIGFTRHLIKSTAGDPESIHPVDFDRDQDVDVVVAYENGTTAPDTFAWFENDGTSAGLKERLIENGNLTNGANSIFPVDFDRDGDTDVVTAAWLSDVFSWYKRIQPPGADFSFTPSSPESDSEVQFVDQSSDSDGLISSWNWSFGDGTDTTVQDPNHIYGDTGTFDVQLVVEDEDGAQDTVQRSVTVVEDSSTDDGGSSSSGGGGGGGSCLIGRSGLADTQLGTLRDFRDASLDSAAGRHLTTLYYQWFGGKSVSPATP